MEDSALFYLFYTFFFFILCWDLKRDSECKDLVFRSVFRRVEIVQEVCMGFIQSIFHDLEVQRSLGGQKYVDIRLQADDAWLVVMFQFMPKVLDGVEVRAPCRPANVFFMDLALCMRTLACLTGNGLSSYPKYHCAVRCIVKNSLH